MMKAPVRCLTLFLGLALPLVSGQGEEPKNRGGKPAKKGAESISELMRHKLEHSQKILEGITLNNLATVEKNAQELILISKKVEWRVVKTPQYQRYSDEFRQAAEDMITHSKEKNLDAATLSYLQMTLTCVRCHKHVREVRMTRLERKGNDHVAGDLPGFRSTVPAP
jgi:hypothetical protein